MAEHGRFRFSMRRPGTGTPRFSEFIQSRKGPTVIRGIIGLLIVVAIVLVLLKVAIAGGILGLIAIVLLILLLMGRL